MENQDGLWRSGDGLMAKLVAFFIGNKLFAVAALLFVLLGGLRFAPFDWDIPFIPRDPVPVDAIPDLGENQQIVFTEWPGRSPRDIEDQITYPLTVRLMNVRGVRVVRGMSMFGFSSVFVVFDDDIDFYWARDRIQERLNTLAANELPEGVRPRLGPDATPLGQVLWYTVEGRSPEGEPVGGWDLQELRAAQDWQVKLELLSVPGVAEVASVGGFVKEYQVEVDPDALHGHRVSIAQVVDALRRSNLDIGVRTMEINGVEYLIRGIGLAKNLEDFELAVVSESGHVPIRVKDVAKVSLGPALRRGALDKDGAEAVGGVVVAQFGANPMAVLRGVHRRVEAINASLPSRLVPVPDADGIERMVESRMTIVPFYDRSQLIGETLETLNEALGQQILVTILVVVVMLAHLRSSLLVGMALPLAVLAAFIAMKVFGVTANVVALAGIAIAIGAIVDMGIILCDGIVERLANPPPGEGVVQSVYRAAAEVAGAVSTAVATTIIGFIPIFALVGDQGKLYRPLAFTKIFALGGSLLIALLIIPPLACWLMRWRRARGDRDNRAARLIANAAVVLAALLALAAYWSPLGIGLGLIANAVFVAVLVGGFLGFFHLVKVFYEPMLRWCLANKATFLTLPVLIVAAGLYVWSGLGRELMPPFDEGSFLFMPSMMPHGSIGEAMEVLRHQDLAIAAIPEVEGAVGKIGRAESPLDPAPIGMIETVINYHGEYSRDSRGRLARFRYDPNLVGYEMDKRGNRVAAPDGEPYQVRGLWPREEHGSLIPDPNGRPFRMWRRALDPELNPGRQAWTGIRSPDDIWNEIVHVTSYPGVTSAGKLGPIWTRYVMLQSGLRSDSGMRVIARGQLTLDELQKAGLKLEAALAGMAAVNPLSISPDRVVGKPYLELEIDRQAIARYGLNVADVQAVVSAAVGGVHATRTIEGRERYDVLVRYQRELRDSPETLMRVLVPIGDGGHVPLRELVVGRELRYISGPTVIKSEDGALAMYISFEAAAGLAPIDAVESVKERLAAMSAAGELRLPPGVVYDFVGAYQQHQQTSESLAVLIPTSLALIFLILYLNFRRLSLALVVFSGVAVAWGGGFILIGLYGEPWFLNFSVLGVHVGQLFHVAPVNMSTAIWVGLLALFGIASDDGVVMATYLEQSFQENDPQDRHELVEAVVAGASRRVRPCLMTTATTIIALLPVLTSTGRGSEIMLPMAIPVFGGMLFEVVTMFVVPVLVAANRGRHMSVKPS